MGAWDYGPFDNDGAMDLFGELVTGSAADRERRLVSAMQEVVGSDEYVENPEVQAAVAAAALIAVCLEESLPLPSYREEWLAQPLEITPELRELAARTFARAFSATDNEWYDLWDEAGALDKVEAILEPYRRAVSAT
ncbi:DUF4259 domain-containing protein [Actinomadura scrupuli]|uniref:DUF4259 domain-containing protein n=1 Tax=Actinomadura scrupuli TaxID=559629 RepID=UPI003D964C31